MRRYFGITCFLVLITVVLDLWPESSAQSGLEVLGKVGDWSISGSGGQCQAGRQMGLGQFAVGLSPDGAFMTLQDLTWKLSPNRRNTTPVKVLFDGEEAFDTEALVIAMVSALQVFVRFTDMSDEEFWMRLLSAESMQVEGRFGSSSSAMVNLENVGNALPLLRECAERFLPGTALPF